MLSGGPWHGGVCQPSRLRRIFGFVRSSDGVSLVEFALVLPMLVLVLLGGYEIARFMLLNQNLSRLATNTSDLVSRTESISIEEIDQVFEAAQHILRPFTLGDRGTILVSSVSVEGIAPPMVNWQHSSDVIPRVSSAVGSPGDPATLPQGFVLREDQDVIIAEVFYDYQPFLGFVTTSKQIYNFAVHRPRFGPLTVLEPSPPP